ncbi:MAG TPA: hypothetical protein VE733_20000 [Streptosporangiaceae bacterium]|nr:hypothetical protein [Streptosporangiaceae bacterium]
MWEGTGAFAEARGFCELWGLDGTVLVDERGELADRLGIRGVPANVFVDADGTVTAVGAATPGELVTATRQLLGPAAPAGLDRLGEPDPGEDGAGPDITSWDRHADDGGPEAGQPGRPQT